MGDTTDRYRIQLDFNKEAFLELEKLKADVGVSSRAETVRYAMRVLRWAINTLQSGCQILVSRTSGVSEVEFPFLPHGVVAESGEPLQEWTREARKAASGWVSRGREILTKEQQREQARAAYEAGRKAYKETVRDERKTEP